jgi:hypothetical protein
MNRREVLVAGVAGVLAPWLNAQPRRAAELGEYIGNAGLSHDLRRYLKPLGDRPIRPGKERVVYSGALQFSAAPETAEVTHQMPGLLRAVRPGKKNVAFDGDLVRSSNGQLDKDDEDLLESFVNDSTEGMFASIVSGGAVRMLGEGFRPSPKENPTYVGPAFDLIEVSAQVRTRRNRAVRSKRYYFNSQSSLLHKVRYLDPESTTRTIIETRFSDWRTVDGVAVPGLIERFEGTRRTVSFRSQALVVQGKVDAATFRTA